VSSEEAPIIGSLNEKPLHAALKKHVAGPDASFEVPLDGFVIDVVDGDELVEIQTRSFGSLKRKLGLLTKDHKVRLVHPIAREKWIVKAGSKSPRRKSPKRGTVLDIFDELTSIPQLMKQENFSLHVVLTQEEELRSYQPGKHWRKRGWRTEERRLLSVVEEYRFETPNDLNALLPDDLAEPFTTQTLAKGLEKPRAVAQKMAYCLKHMDAIEEVGKEARYILYERRD